MIPLRLQAGRKVIWCRAIRESYYQIGRVSTVPIREMEGLRVFRHTSIQDEANADLQRMVRVRPAHNMRRTSNEDSKVLLGAGIPWEKQISSFGFSVVPFCSS